MYAYTFISGNVDKMAITWAIEIADLVPLETSRELSKLKNIIAKDNVKDLAKTQKGKFDKYAEKQNKTNKESPDNQNADKDFIEDNALDKRVEEEFDKYLLGVDFNNAINVTKKIDKIKTGNMAALQNDFNDYLQKEFWNNSEFSQYMNLLKNAEIKNAVQSFSFELEALSQEVIDSLAPDQSAVENQSWHDQSGNTFLNDRGGGNTDKKEGKKWENKEAKKYIHANNYYEPYADTSYTTLTKEQHIENIYRDNKLAKVMESVFDDEEGKELRRWTFRVNLGIENGLAGIIIAIREANEMGHSATPDTWSNAYKLYAKLTEKHILPTNGDAIDLEFSRKELKEIIDAGLIHYKRDWWLDNEINKVAKILSRAQRKDLDAFASLLQSKSDIVMAIKEWNNAKEMTGNDVEHPGETSLINADNVLAFLCDISSDAQIAATPKRKDNKEQRNQWDVGTLFGQQIMFTIEQAIAVKNVELGDPQGEQLVIQNIVKNMQISDSRNLTEIQRLPLKTMQDDITKCTRENLAKLVNGNTNEGIQAMPEMKIFFLDAIKKINGWSKAIQPDLRDTLVGRDSESVLSLYETETELKIKLDEILSQSEDPETKLMIRKEGLVRVRETIFTKIMTALDHIEITTNNGAKTQLQAAGIDKWREVHALKKELLEKTIKSLILSWIHYSTTGGWRFTLGYGKEWKSESGRTKRNRWAGGWVIIESGKVELVINLSGEVAEQYNHKRVINADLSQVKKAKYLGIEWWAIAGIQTENLTKIEAEAYAGINRQQDPEVGINQIDKQYRAVSEEIFDVNSFSTAELSDREQFRKKIQDRIDKEQIDTVYGWFVTKNKKHLESNLKFMVSYMDANKFFGADGIFIKFPKVNRTNSINALLDIIQSGNIEQRRHDVISGLHGKIALTKLSFGVTTNALTLTSWKASSNTPPPPPHTGADGEPAGTPTDTQQSSWGQDRFGIAGVYVGLRISTWKNIYVPNVAQYLFTQYETGQGIGMEYLNNPAKDLNKYGQYLIALYNDTKHRLTYEVDAGRLILRFDPQWSDLSLAKFLNIHATSDAQKWFSLRGNVLTIGNVGDMAGSTITEGKGVCRILSLGSKKLDDTERVTGNIWATIVEPMKLIETWKNIPRTQEKIQDKIISNMTGEGKNAEKVKTETASFFDAEGKLQKPANYKVVFEPATIEWTSLKYNWTLTIKKLSDKTFSVSFDTNTSPDKLTISYIDQEEYDGALTAAEAIPSNREIKTITSSTEIKTTFNMPANLSNVFDEQTEKALSIFDDYNQTLYKEFMESIVGIWLDAFIDATDYASAFTVLKRILSKNPKYDQLPDLKSLIEKPDLSVNERILIVDKFKTIFSYITYLSDGKADGSNLSALITRRWSIYTSMEWPDGMKYPLTTEYRKTILANLKGENQLTREPVENLIGFTAFYRLNGTGRKYAMTPVGGTNVLMWSTLEESMMSINEHDKGNAQNRFIKNLDVNSDNKKMVVEKINSLLKKNNITIMEKDIPTLLTWKYLSIDSFRKISIDITRMFYLLGECGNESLGMKIENINIQEFKNIPVPGKYTASWTPEKEYTGGMDLNIKSHSITSQVLTQEKKIGLRHHQTIESLATPPPPPPTGVDPLPPPPPWPTGVDP